MRIFIIVLFLFSLTACGQWSQEGNGWWRETGHRGWHGKTGQSGWYAESDDEWYGDDLKETGNQCNVYGRCGK